MWKVTEPKQWAAYESYHSPGRTPHTISHDPSSTTPGLREYLHRGLLITVSRDINVGHGGLPSSGYGAIHNGELDAELRRPLRQR